MKHFAVGDLNSRAECSANEKASLQPNSIQVLARNQSCRDTLGLFDEKLETRLANTAKHMENRKTCGKIGVRPLNTPMKVSSNP